MTTTTLKLNRPSCNNKKKTCTNNRILGRVFYTPSVVFWADTIPICFALSITFIPIRSNCAVWISSKTRDDRFSTLRATRKRVFSSGSTHLNKLSEMKREFPTVSQTTGLLLLPVIKRVIQSNVLFFYHENNKNYVLEHCMGWVWRSSAFANIVSIIIFLSCFLFLFSATLQCQRQAIAG